MDGHRFDALTKALATGVSRRRVLKSIVASGAGAIAVAGGANVSADPGANSVCAQWCHANYSGSDAGDCTSQAAQGGGPCYACGGPMSGLPGAWSPYTRGSATWELVCDNGAPGYSSSSVRFTLSNSTDKAYISTTAYNGVALSDLSALSYWTYQASNTGAQAVSINIFLDLGGGTYHYLVYEPYENNGGAVPTGVWQNWDAMSGVWWERGAIGGPYEPLSYFANKHPNAVIAYDGVALNAGSGWTNFDGNVDGFVINDDVWDF